MEFKHFSHHHGLVLHHIAQESEIHCSGCKSPGSGEFYVCWQCSYFLHGQCFRATRSLKHPSHPLHPLTLVPFPTHPSGSFLCNTCHKAGDGLSYSCSACEFDIHVNCAHMSNASNHLVPLSPVVNYPNPNNPIYPPPIQTAPYPPQNATIPNGTQTYPPQPQITSYPPNPINTYPNFTPTTNTPPPNEPQNYNSFHQTHGVHQNHAFPQPNQTLPLQSYNSFHQTHGAHQNPAFPQPNEIPTLQSHNSFHQTHGAHQNPAFPQPNETPPPQNFVPPANYPPATNPPPPQLNPTTPTYTTTNPPPPPTTNPQPKPPTNMIKHFSHPHVLKPMEIERTNKKVCSACEIELSGSAYCCTEPHCTFNLHKACFDSPRELRHKSHLQHPLTLLPSPPYSDGFTCNACLKDGKAFVYTCATCSYDLHIDCVQWPDTVTRQDHKHPLTLYYSSPAAEATQDVTFMCDMCKNPVHEMAWVYYCRECDFGTHLECVASGIKQQNSGSAGGGNQEELITETELKFAVLQLLLEAQGRKAALESI